MRMKASFSLRILIIAITAISLIAGYLAYQTPRSFSRFTAPNYVVEMMDATVVAWDIDGPNARIFGDRDGLFGHCVIDYPSDPRHAYIMVLSIKTKSGKLLCVAGPPSNHIIAPPPSNIGHHQLGIPKEELSVEELPEATIWAEIRIEDKYGNVLFHGVKESETYAEALARAKQGTPGTLP